MLSRVFRHRRPLGIGAVRQDVVIGIGNRSVLSRMSSDHTADPGAFHMKKIGNREVVGHGANSLPTYIDCIEYPFPAIRFRESTPELMALREKERGDWKKLSIYEKKCLYRYSFRQTVAEFEAPPKDTRYCLGVVMLGLSITFWFQTFLHQYVTPVWPKSLSKESRIAQYYRQVDLNMQPLDGIPRPPGAEKRVFPKNKEMLKKYQETVND